MPKRLLVLNGLSILAVILFHAEGWGFTAMFSWAHRYEALALPWQPALAPFGYYAMRLIEQLVSFSIPAFLFVSGFFVAFSAGRQQRLDRKIVWARIKYLLVPYVFWSMILWVFLALDGRRFGALDYVRLLLTGGSNPAFYYVPLLIQYYLLAPIIVRLARTQWLPLLLVTGVLQLVLHIGQYPSLLGIEPPWLQTLNSLLPKWLFTYRLFWFCLGVVANLHLAALKRGLERFKWLALGGATALFVLGFIEFEVLGWLAQAPALPMRETVVDAFYALAFILAYLAFGEVRWPQSEALTSLGTKSYGIYLAHSPVMELVSRVLYHVAPWLLGYPLILIPLLVFIGLGVPLFLMRLILQSPARRWYVYLFG